MIDIVERLIVYRDRPGRSRAGRELLAEAANEIERLTSALVTQTRDAHNAIVRLEKRVADLEIIWRDHHHDDSGNAKT